MAAGDEDMSAVLNLAIALWSVGLLCELGDSWSIHGDEMVVLDVEGRVVRKYELRDNE